MAPIEVIDCTQPDVVPHKCTCDEKCDPHRAIRWITTLEKQGLPENPVLEKELIEFYILLMQQARLIAVADNTVMLYQTALTAVTQREGGHLRVSQSDINATKGLLLIPNVSSETEEISFTLSTVEQEVQAAKARVERGEAVHEALEEGHAFVGKS